MLTRILIILLGCSLATLVYAGRVKSPAVIEIEDFSKFKTDIFPDGWKARGGDESKVYRVKGVREKYKV